jgi:hypothetical protein
LKRGKWRVSNRVIRVRKKYRGRVSVEGDGTAPSTLLSFSLQSERAPPMSMINSLRAGKNALSMEGERRVTP